MKRTFPETFTLPLSLEHNLQAQIYFNSNVLNHHDHDHHHHHEHEHDDEDNDDDDDDDDDDDLGKA